MFGDDNNKVHALAIRMYHDGRDAINQRSTKVSAAMQRRERGATLVEYGVLLLSVFIIAIVAVSLFGDAVVALFETAPDPLVEPEAADPAP